MIEIRHIVAGYAMAGLITFGHSAANVPADRCATYIGRTECGVFNGVVAAALWPLYVSWSLFEAGGAE